MNGLNKDMVDLIEFKKSSISFIKKKENLKENLLKLCKINVSNFQLLHLIEMYEKYIGFEETLINTEFEEKY
jgi:hypothetical protein